jgi:hypothetical protein
MKSFVTVGINSDEDEALSSRVMVETRVVTPKMDHDIGHGSPSADANSGTAARRP